MGSRENDELVAASLQAFGMGLAAVEDAVRENTTQRALPPVVNFAPEIKAEAPPPLVSVTVPTPEVNVTVPVPSVTVEAAKAPDVSVTIDARGRAAYVCRMTR